MQALQTLIPGVALAVSVWALWWSWRGWRESNRPIVTVHIETHGDSVGAIPYNLVVQNSGNRPAINVRLWTDISALRDCLDAQAAGEIQTTLFEHVSRCFSANAAIPLLVPGARSTNSFGYSGSGEQGRPFWKYGSTFHVDVVYLDVESHEYRHRLLVQVRDSIGFAGGSWGITHAS